MIIAIIILWLSLSIGTGVIASSKGRDGLGYFLLALVTSPLIGLILIAAMPSLYYIDASGVQRRVVRESELKKLFDSDAPRRKARIRKIEGIVATIILGMVVVVVMISSFR